MFVNISRPVKFVIQSQLLWINEDLRNVTPNNNNRKNNNNDSKRVNTETI